MAMTEQAKKARKAYKKTKPYILEYVQQRTAPAEQKRIASGNINDIILEALNGTAMDV